MDYCGVVTKSKLTRKKKFWCAIFTINEFCFEKIYLGQSANYFGNSNTTLKTPFHLPTPSITEIEQRSSCILSLYDVTSHSIPTTITHKDSKKIFYRKNNIMERLLRLIRKRTKDDYHKYEREPKTTTIDTNVNQKHYWYEKEPKSTTINTKENQRRLR